MEDGHCTHSCAVTRTELLVSRSCSSSVSFKCSLTPFPCVLPLNVATVPTCAPCSRRIMASCLLLTMLVRYGWLVCDQPSADPGRGRGAESTVTDEGCVGDTFIYLPSLSSPLRPLSLQSQLMQPYACSLKC